jgi:phosphoglycolate phosphatase
MDVGRVKLAVFDCDGTLVDSQHSIIASMNAGFDTLGLPRADRNDIRRVVGLPLMTAIQQLLPDASTDVVEQVRAGYGKAWHQLRETDGLDEPLFPGLMPTLDQLEQDGWLLGVATGKSRRGLDGTLESHDILERFVTLQTADRARGKPHPEMLLNAMAETGAAPSETVMIGDTTFDIEMARNAGVIAIGVSWGYHEVEELQLAGAAKVIDSFDELAETLGQIMENS